MDKVYYVWYDDNCNCCVAEYEVIMSNEIFTYVKKGINSKSLIEIQTDMIYMTKDDIRLCPKGYYAVSFTDEEISRYSLKFKSIKLERDMSDLVRKKSRLMRELDSVENQLTELTKLSEEIKYVDPS